jgi:hypothetical protein
VPLVDPNGNAAGIALVDGEPTPTSGIVLSDDPDLPPWPTPNPAAPMTLQWAMALTDRHDTHRAKMVETPTEILEDGRDFLQRYVALLQGQIDELPVRLEQAQQAHAEAERQAQDAWAAMVARAKRDVRRPEAHSLPPMAAVGPLAGPTFLFPGDMLLSTGEPVDQTIEGRRWARACERVGTALREVNRLDRRRADLLFSAAGVGPPRQQLAALEDALAARAGGQALMARQAEHAAQEASERARVDHELRRQDAARTRAAIDMHRSELARLEQHLADVEGDGHAWCGTESRGAAPDHAPQVLGHRPHAYA